MSPSLCYLLTLDVRPSVPNSLNLEQIRRHCVSPLGTPPPRKNGWSHSCYYSQITHTTMAFLVRSIPSAIRLSLAGGTAYGTTKIGVWSDSSKSRDKLREMRKSLYEIEYPAAVSKYSRPTTSSVSMHLIASCDVTDPSFPHH